jgi:hypothetical protein
MNLKWLSLFAIAGGSAFAFETQTVFHSNVVSNHTLTFNQPKLCDPTVVQVIRSITKNKGQQFDFKPRYFPVRSSSFFFLS